MYDFGNCEFAKSMFLFPRKAEVVKTNEMWLSLSVVRKRKMYAQYPKAGDEGRMIVVSISMNK